VVVGVEVEVEVELVLGAEARKLEGRESLSDREQS